MLVPFRRRHNGGSEPEYETISTRRNGDRLIGRRGPLAEDLYAAGTPPVHGLAAKPAPSKRVVDVSIGDELDVEREGTTWVVRDRDGILGHLRWDAGLDGKAHAVTGETIVLPARGVLHIERLVVDDAGVTKDISGYVTSA